MFNRNAQTTEKRFIIDIKDRREAYHDDVINDKVSIRREYNLADAMTKPFIVIKLIHT